jgi:hypothetical protein
MEPKNQIVKNQLHYEKKNIYFMYNKENVLIIILLLAEFEVQTISGVHANFSSTQLQALFNHN